LKRAKCKTIRIVRGKSRAINNGVISGILIQRGIIKKRCEGKIPGGGVQIEKLN